MARLVATITVLIYRDKLSTIPVYRPIYFYHAVVSQTVFGTNSATN